MFNFICGEIVEISEGYVVLKCGGIGYELSVSNFTLTKCKTGKEIQLFTFLSVKEDGIALFGFADADEKRMFLKLTSVSGVGAKTALTALSGISPNDLCVAIINADIAQLTRVKGLGKKTAERIVLELRGSLSDYSFFESNTNALSAGITDNEAVSILVSLGLTKNEASTRVKTAMREGLTVTEDIVSFALKNPNKKK